MKLHSLDLPPDRPGPPAWARALRTMWLGLLLGLLGALLVVAAVGIVRRPAEPRFGPEVPPEVAARLRAHLPAAPDGPVWRLASAVQTPWGEVVRLRPSVAEIEVRGADCVLHLDDRFAEPARLERDPASVDWAGIAAALSHGASSEKSGTLLRSLLGPAPTAPPETQPPPQTPPLPDPRGAELGPAAPSHLRVEAGPSWFVSLHDAARGAERWSLRAELTLEGTGTSLEAVLSRLPWRGDPPSGYGPVDLELTCDPATLEVLEARDARIRADGTALLFDPNPIVTSGRAELRDGDAVDLWRRRVTLRDLDGTGALRGPRVEVTTGRPPRAQELSLAFDYLSDDPRFEEAMAYFHGHRSIARAESLGFPALLKSALRLRVHASSADNSWYSRPARQLFFGDGGVDDPEDADIILHETAHALHDAIVPGFGEGDTRAIGEGFADFWAASITGGACVGDWDATSYSPPCLRRTDEPAVWPAWLLGSPHHDGAIWSALLWDLRRLLGAPEAERLALAALFEQDTGTTYPEAARGLVRAAGRLGLADRANEIREAIARRGLGPRRIEVTLAPGESRRIDLLSAGRFLDAPVAAIVLQWDGRVLFPATSEAFESRPFPQGPPCLVACGLDDAPAGVRLEADATFEGEAGRLDLRWRDGTATAARSALSWNLTSGEVWWEFEHMPAGSLRFYTGASAGPPGPGAPADATRLDLADLPAQGIAGLRAFQAEVPEGAGPGAPSPLLGARYSVAGEPGGTFSLRLLRRPIPIAGEAPLLVVQPNPLRDRAEVRLLLHAGARGALSVHDATGRRVARLAEDDWPAGVTVLEWTPSDGGRRLPSGLYWVRLETPGRSAARQVLVLP